MKQIYHPWWKWECYKNGFYNTCPINGYTSAECKQLYAEFLGDLILFELALNRVMIQWKYSCEQFLSNKAMNRIAWLGQASACIYLGLPAVFRSGFKLLSIEKQQKANYLAERYLMLWLQKYKNT